MVVYRKLNEFKIERGKTTGKIGFVPTMGALHQGHLSLVKMSLLECKYTVVSIYVNPFQFNDKRDFYKYPRNLEKDLELLKKMNHSIIFAPESDAEVYYYSSQKEKNEAITKVNTFISRYEKEAILSSMEAKYRPGHFNGVLAVIERLFSIVIPSVAYFGEKDYQQFLIIKKFSEEFFPDITIRMGKTIREENGLAFSSRNIRLSKSAREQASVIYNTLLRACKAIKNGIKYQKIIEDAYETLHANGFTVEYFEIRDNDTLLENPSPENARCFTAVYIENVRLIDNLYVGDV